MCILALDVGTSALTQPGSPMLDPSFLGGDRLEIEAHRASFRDLTLTTDRIDLLAALLDVMQRGHRQAVADLSLGDNFERVFLTGGGAEIVQRLIPNTPARRCACSKNARCMGPPRCSQFPERST